MTSPQPLSLTEHPANSSTPAGLARVLVDAEGAAFMCSLSKSKFRTHIAPHVAQVKIGRTRLYYVESLKEVAAHLTHQGAERGSLHNIISKSLSQKKIPTNPLDALLKF